jgi:hypothetical protein
LVFACSSSFSRLGIQSRRPAPATPKKEYGEGKQYDLDEHAAPGGAQRQIELDGFGLHDRPAIAPQVFAYCQRQSLVNQRIEPPMA